MAVSESEDEIVIEGEGIEGEGLSETLRGTRIQTHTLCTAKATVWKTSRQPSARTWPCVNKGNPDTARIYSLLLNQHILQLTRSSWCEKGSKQRWAHKKKKPRGRGSALRRKRRRSRRRFKSTGCRRKKIERNLCRKRCVRVCGCVCVCMWVCMCAYMSVVRGCERVSLCDYACICVYSRAQVGTCIHTCNTHTC